VDYTSLPIPTGLQSATEEYDGNSWTTSPGSLNTARYGLAGTGTQTAGLAFGGYSGAPTPTSATEEYNGATWTSVNAMNTATQYRAAAGIQTAALAFGGNSTCYRSNRRIRWNKLGK
jgi:hypothetical protein